jgi:hypothetical protein
VAGAYVAGKMDFPGGVDPEHATGALNACVQRIGLIDGACCGEQQ